MKILITGANGFIGKNIVKELENQGYKDLLLYSNKNTKDDLENFVTECEFVIHLAGVNRPENSEDFMQGNFDLTSQLLNLLKKNNNKSPILFTSSIQAEKDNLYGISKKASEELLLHYSKSADVDIFVYRLPNVFGKWSKPNYNTVVATYCHNIARDLKIEINNPETELNLVYIDDVIKEFIETIKGYTTKETGFCNIPITYSISLQLLADKIKSFKETRDNLSIPNMQDSLEKKLYSTYLSFLPENKFSYDLKMNSDHRGSFTEFIRTPDRGQVSVNITKPGITKGQHWHHTKNEKFLVVSGHGLISFRNANFDNVINYEVKGEKLQVVDIPPGYTHSISNIGEKDLITLMWVNECFDKNHPDTIFLEV